VSVRAAAVVAGSLLLLVSCAPAADPTPAPSPDRAALSQRLISDPLSVGPDNGPGCAAAVGRQGTVVWHGAHGLADVKARTPITESTIFDIGSVTKQFTATTILLLVAEGKLRLDDKLSDHVDGLPRWSDDVTIHQLIHHTSGIPEYIPLLEAKGYTLQQPLGRKRAFEVIAEATRLDFKPGTRFAYSNSNYILLGYLIERVTRAPIADVLANRIFRPLGLGMVMEPTAPVTGKARSYRVGAYGTGDEIADWHWDASGGAGIQSRVSDLVRWADNYRTGKLGGAALLHAQLAHAVDIGDGDGTRYGAGMFIPSDGSLVHGGEYGGFHTLLRVSPDRQQELVVACNLFDADIEAIGEKLGALWQL
jgi:CubicO group peptidase (beta-lactamase class C family)